MDQSRSGPGRTTFERSPRRSERSLMTLAQELLDILVCPKCKGDLEYRTEPEEQLVCHTCRLVYRVEDDIPVMLLEEAVPF